MEEKNVYQDVLKEVEQIEKRHKSLENFVKKTTNLSDKHTLKIEEEYSLNASKMTQIYDKLLPLEFADLCDFQNLTGRFDGTNSETW